MEHVLQALEQTFTKSAIDDLKKYLERNARYKKWLMFSDYCVGDDGKPNDTIAFTVMPYDMRPDELKKSISSVVPRDLKKTKNIDPELVAYLREGRLFHIAVVIDSIAGITNRDGRDPKEIIQSDLDGMIRMINAWPIEFEGQESYFESIKKKIRLAKNELSKKSANLRLYREVVFVPFVAAYICYLFTKHNGAGIFGWFSDRDRILEAYDRLAIDLVTMNHAAICQRNAIDERSTEITFGDPFQKEGGPMWYDEMNRLPDYVAGALADWDFQEGSCNSEKCLEIIENVFGDNDGLVILKASVTKDGAQFSRLQFARKIQYSDQPRADDP